MQRFFWITLGTVIALALPAGCLLAQDDADKRGCELIARREVVVHPKEGSYQHVLDDCLDIWKKDPDHAKMMVALDVSLISAECASQKRPWCGEAESAARDAPETFVVKAHPSTQRDSIRVEAGRIEQDIYEVEKAEQAFYHDHGIYTTNSRLLQPYVRDLGLKISHGDWDEVWIQDNDHDGQKIEISLKQLGKHGISCGLWLEPGSKYEAECLSPLWH